MTKIFLIALTLFSAITISAPNAHSARTSVDYDARVSALDKLGTCQTSIQHGYAVIALKWIDAFEEWDLKTRLDLFAPDFVIWHS